MIWTAKDPRGFYGSALARGPLRPGIWYSRGVPPGKGYGPREWFYGLKIRGGPFIPGTPRIEGVIVRERAMANARCWHPGFMVVRRSTYGWRPKSRPPELVVAAVERYLAHCVRHEDCREHRELADACWLARAERPKYRDRTRSRRSRRGRI